MVFRGGTRCLSSVPSTIYCSKISDFSVHVAMIYSNAAKWFITLWSYVGFNCSTA